MPGSNVMSTCARMHEFSRLMYAHILETSILVSGSVKHDSGNELTPLWQDKG